MSYSPSVISATQCSVQCLIVVIACGLSLSTIGCDTKHSESSNSESTAGTQAGAQGGSVTTPRVVIEPTEAYGDELIGFRNGEVTENAQNTAPNANVSTESFGAPPPSPDYDESYGEVAGTDSGDYEPEEYEEPPMPSYSIAFDEGALAQLHGEGAEWGFVYEGTIESRAYELVRHWWLNLGEQSFAQNSLIISYDEGRVNASTQTYLGVSSEFRGPIQYEEQLQVFSQLDLELPQEASDLMSVDQSTQALLIQETYQDGSQAGRSLRARCIVGASDSQQEGEVLYSAQVDELYEVPFVSIASVTPLISIDDNTSTEEVNQAISHEFGFENSLLELGGERCQCFDESGENEINCEDFDRTIDPNLPAEQPFYLTAESPLSTFSLDVDTASYTLVRQALNQGSMPDPSGVRVEEMINYFKYNYALPQNDQPFTVYTELADCPWNPDSKLAMIGLRGQEVQVDDQPPANLVYLLDVSGSMREEMWLIKPAFRLLTRQLRPQDTLSIVAYAGHDAVVLEGVSGDQQDEILAAIEDLENGGSTNGEMGIRRAYQIATANFKPGGNNRVILATDGDFNVGVNSEEELVELIQEQADSGVFLTIYGFSTYYNGNYQDAKMEELSNHGNGTYFFIDGATEAQRAFMHSLSGTLLTIAKDVKIQVQFNPDIVSGYRLIGYDNRILSNRDFNDDSVDAGELGNGEEMTAFYEVILAESAVEVPPPVRGRVIPPVEGEIEDELNREQLMSVRMRYKLPNAEESSLVVTPIPNRVNSTPTLKFTFASTVAHLGLALRGSSYLNNHNISEIGARLEMLGDIDSPAINELRMLIEAADTLAP